MTTLDLPRTGERAREPVVRVLKAPPPGRFPKLERDPPRLAMRPRQSPDDSQPGCTQRTRFSPVRRRAARPVASAGMQPRAAAPAEGPARQAAAAGLLPQGSAAPNPQNNQPRRVDSRRRTRHHPTNVRTPPRGAGSHGHTIDPLRKRAGPRNGPCRRRSNRPGISQAPGTAKAMTVWKADTARLARASVPPTG